MKKGSKYYLKDAKNKCRKAFKKKTNIINFYINFIPSLILRMILFIFAPMFVSQDYKMAEMIKLDKNIDLAESFEPWDNKKRLRNSLLLILEIVGIYLGMLIVILIPTGLLGFLGFIIGRSLTSFNLVSLNITGWYIIAAIFAAPGAIVLLIATILYPFYISPLFYLSGQIDENGLSKVMKNTFATLRRGGKWTIFVIGFTKALGFILLTALFIGIPVAGYLLSPIYIVDNISNIIQTAILVLSPVLVALYLKSIARCYLEYRVAMSEFLDDFFLRPQNERTEGINVMSTNVRRQDVINYKDNLVKLFDETEDMSPTEFFEYDNGEIINENEEVEPVQLFEETVNDETKETINEETSKEEVKEVEIKPLEEETKVEVQEPVAEEKNVTEANNEPKNEELANANDEVKEEA